MHEQDDSGRMYVSVLVELETEVYNIVDEEVIYESAWFRSNLLRIIKVAEEEEEGEEGQEGSKSRLFGHGLGHHPPIKHSLMRDKSLELEIGHNISDDSLFSGTLSGNEIFQPPASLRPFLIRCCSIRQGIGWKGENFSKNFAYDGDSDDEEASQA